MTPHLHKRSEPTEMLLLRRSFGLSGLKSQLPRRPSILVRVCSINSIPDVCQPPHLYPSLLSSIFSASSPPSLHYMPPGHNHVLVVATSLRACTCGPVRRAECDRRCVFTRHLPPGRIKNSPCCIGTAARAG